MRILKTLAAASLAVAASSFAASAASVTCGMFTYELEASSAAVCVSGNDTGNNGISQSDSYFGDTGWVYSQKIAANGTDDTGNSAGVAGDLMVTFSDVLQSGEGGGSEGTWAVNDYSAFSDQIMITIKKQNNFAAFLVDPNTYSGTWNTFKASNGNDNNVISHSAVFYLPGGSDDDDDDDDTTNPVPLPAAGWLMLAGLGGIAAMRRRK